MTTERTLALVLFVVSGVLLTGLAPPALRVWRIYSGTRSRRQLDAAGTAPIASPPVAQRIEALRSLSFERLGETFVDLPNAGRRFAWQLVDETHTIYAAVVPIEPTAALTAIYSAWSDGTWLTTMHPIGESADAPDFVVQTVRSTVDEAVGAHRAREAALQSAKGAPRRIDSMSDLLALDADYRRRHGGRTLIRRTLRLVLPAILAAVLAGVSLLLLIVSAR